MDGIMFSVVLLLAVLINNSQADVKVSGSALLVSDVSSLMCITTVDLSLYRARKATYHQWNQVYDAKTDPFIMNLPAIEAINTHLIIELEKFDNNTAIYSAVSVVTNGTLGVMNFNTYCPGLEEAWINLRNDGFYEYQIDKIFNFEITTPTTFSCQAYSHFSDNIQVGWINTSQNRIYMYNKTKTVLTLTAAHNGSMLCCIYYTVKGDTNGLKHIRRFVKDKTLLIHQEKLSSALEPSETTAESYCESSNVPLISDTKCIPSPKINGKISNATNDSGENSNATNELGKNSNATNEPSKNSYATNDSGENSNATNEPGKNSNATTGLGENSNATNEPGKDSYATNKLSETSNATTETVKNINTTVKTDSSDHDVATIIASISASVLVLLVVIYVVHKQCRRGTNQRERPQLPLPKIPSQLSPDELDPNSPFYLNLLFRRECQLEIQAREEPQYEEIIY